MSGDDDRAWAELVESFHAPTVPDDSRRWPAAEDLTSDDSGDDTGDSSDSGGDSTTSYRDASVTLGPLPAVRDRPGGADRHDDGVGPVDDTDHFVPAPPPPIPRGDLISRLAWYGVIGSPALLLVSAAVQWSPPGWLLGLMVVAFVGGFVTLVARMRRHHDPDDGAVL